MISSGLAAWICDASHSTPSQRRSISWACRTHAEPVWSKSAQNIATKRKITDNRAAAARPSRPNTSRKKARPPGGTCTNRSRPSQNTIVAPSMNKPGTPKRRAGTIMFQQPGREQRREKGAEVDRKVEPAIDFGKQMLIGGAELVADVRRDAGLDAARADRDQRQPPKQAESRVVQRQRQMPQTVDERQPNDRAVFTPPGVCYQPSDERCEINGRREQVVVTLRLFLVHDRQVPRRIKQILRHEDGQYRLHPIEAEPFGGFIADDERDPAGHARGGFRRRAVGRARHDSCGRERNWSGATEAILPAARAQQKTSDVGRRRPTSLVTESIAN